MTTFLYPEVACREALVNAIAHRDLSEEGSGIEIYVFDNRIEVKNPGGLLSSLSLSEITSLRGIHQSRNSYVARTLREIGLMRELGEGMRRIFEVMKSFELAPPEITSTSNSFVLTLHHRPVYTKEESIWLEQYNTLELSMDEKAVSLLGRRGDLIAPNDIIRRLGIVDIEHYRQVVYSLQTKGILETSLTKTAVSSIARKKGVGRRDVGRFKIKPGKDSRPKGSIPRKPLAATKENYNLNTAHSLYVGNIPPNTNKRDLIDAFSNFGQPETVSIPKNNGLSRGYAFIEFERAEIVQRALRAEIVLGGRKLVIKRKLLRKIFQR